MSACFAGVMTAPDPQGVFADVFARIAAAAPLKDQTNGDLAEEFGWLHEAGALAEALPSALSGVVAWSDRPLEIAALLRRLGYASLPAGRLFEGHVNAAQLVGVYGQPSFQARCGSAVKAGDLLGVWGADGPEPVQAEATPEGFRLRGSKIFCSGLGLVGTALISASLDGQICLFGVDVRDGARADRQQWRVSGMRASQSGGYRFDDMRLAPDAMVGGPGDYFAEPYFLGGMYRMCAVQLGGLDALLDETAAVLARRGKASDPLAHHRVGGLARLRWMAAAATEQLAGRIAADADPAEIARDATLTREGVEQCIVEALQIVERCAGSEAHKDMTALSRIRRDLSFYIRQAAVDERLASVGLWHLNGAKGSRK